MILVLFHYRDEDFDFIKKIKDDLWKKLEFNIDSSEKKRQKSIKYLAECCPDLSRSYLQKAAEKMERFL